MQLILVAVLFLLGRLGAARLPNATIRATETLNGLFHYYWQLDPRAKSIGFFFACGQIGGWGGPEQWDKCSCNTRDACTNCYRWWDAVALESLATYGIYMNTKRNASIANTIFAHSPYNSKWNATKDCTFIDDFLWYGIAYLRVYEWLKVMTNISGAKTIIFSSL